MRIQKYITALRLCSFVALVTLLILSSRRHSLLRKLHGYFTFTETTRQHGQGRDGISLGTVSETSNDMEFPQNITEVSNRKNLSQRRTPAGKLPSSILRQCHLNGIAVGSRDLECRKRLPQIIGIGVLKCGTGAMTNFLQMHPNIVHSDPKELYYWNKHNKESLNWYQNRMPVSSKYQLTMEYTPNYIFGHDAPYLIKKNLPDVKFIMMIRDPVIRALSHYVHIKYYSWPSLFKPRSRIPDRETWPFLNNSFETTVLTPSGEVFVDNAVVENGLYEVHLRRWFCIFSREQFLIIDEGVFRSDPVSILHKMEDFLGIPKYFDEYKFHFNEERGIFCEKNPAIICPSSKLKGRKHPSVDPIVLEKLKNYYHPFNLKLEELLGRKFAWT